MPDLRAGDGRACLSHFGTPPRSCMMLGGGYVSITRTPQELSVVCLSENAPAEAEAEVDGPWRALYASGPIPFGLTGVVASLVAPLSAAGCAVFVVSTFDGDVLMVQSAELERTRMLLSEAGHTLV